MKNNISKIIELAQDNAELKRCLEDILIVLNNKNTVVRESRFYIFQKIIEAIKTNEDIAKN